MKKYEIRVGGLYTARVRGQFVIVRVDKIRMVAGFNNRINTVYDVTNLKTGKGTNFQSAAKFRSEVSAAYFKCDGGCSKEWIGANKPWTCSDCAKKATTHCPFVPTTETPATVVPASSGQLDEETCSEEELRNDEFGKFMTAALSPEQDDPERPDLMPMEPVGHRGPHDQGEARELMPEMFRKDIQEGEHGLPFVETGHRVPSSDSPQSVGHVARMTTEPAPTTCASAPATAPTNGLAAKIAAQTTKVATGLTQQQQDILATAKEIEAARGNGQRVMVIGAGAGTGKTFTLKQLEQVLTGNGQYTAFNSSLVAESKAKFTRAACNTTHSLAFRAVGKRFAHRLNSARVRSWEIAQRLGIQDHYVELPESVAPLDEGGKPQLRRLKAAFLAGQVTQAIKRFCQSADSELSTKHFQRFDGIDAPNESTNSERVKRHLLPFAQAAWTDLSSETGTLPFSHDVYVKIWEQGRDQDRPVIAADYILLDEAQDTAPVMLSILQQQTHALLILVGDDNQQIYEWRGAVNAMATFPDVPRKLLSQSFRFGQVVADVANSVLARLQDPTDLIMQGLPSIPTRVCEVRAPRCYLYRTNAGALGKLMSAMEAGKRGHLIGGTGDVIAFCRAALDLQSGKGTTHPELGCFEKWSDVEEYVKEDEGADLKLMVKLVNDFGADRIIKALENMPAEDKADLVISTAHRSKGREWPSVKLGQDFPTANKLTDADRRLLYVAATRAQEELDISQCPTFCGGYGKQVSEDGETGESKFIPGIEVDYTVPMPSAEELAAYRAAKGSLESAPKLAPKPSQLADGLVAQLAPAVAAAANVALANGNGNGNSQSAATEPVRNGWAKLRNGNWGVRGRVGQTGTVEVYKKDGGTGKVLLKRVVWSDATVALYEV